MNIDTVLTVTVSIIVPMLLLWIIQFYNIHFYITN
jgi:hypothetical protein